MHDIILEVERTEEDYFYQLPLEEDFDDVAEAIAASACLTAKKLNASAVVSLTTTGRTATLISGFRPEARIIAMTDFEGTLNRLELAWGIQTFAIKPYRSTDEAMEQIESILLSYGLVKPGDKVILTLGVPVMSHAKTNSIRVYTITGDQKKFDQASLPLRCQPIQKL